jgi:two-component system, sensor histidine kinase and response regulator
MESLKFPTDSVGSGQEALDVIEKALEKGNPYDLVLMDWNMPGMDGAETARRIKEQHGDASPKMLMVTGHDHEEVMKRASEMGFDGFLIKPIHRSRLFNTLMQIFGRLGRGGSPPTSRRGARVLAVEDHEINRQVIIELLEKAGIHVTVACNGAEACSILERETFDMVLMDIQMPVMDGLTAARKIRTMRRRGLKEMPIMAMTAHAMSGDREKSLEAGMNDHITKPIDTGELFAAIERWIPAKAGVEEEQEAATTPKGMIHFGGTKLSILGVDVNAGLSRLGGNEERYIQLLQKFVDDFSGSVNKVREGVASGDMEGALREVHSVKGVAGTLGSSAVYRLSARLEEALSGDATAACPLIDQFEHELDNLFTAITRGLAERGHARQSSLEDLPPGDEVMLKELLTRLSEPLRLRQPKPCRELVAELGQHAWPFDLSLRVSELTKFVGKYRFKEASEVQSRLLEELGGKE